MGKSGRAAQPRTWLASAAVAAATTGTLGLAAPPAGAAVFTSKTALAAAISADGASLTLTATVTNTDLPSGPGISPGGTIVFSDSAHDSLGTLSAPNCGKSSCSVARTVTDAQLANSVSTVTARYSGDSILSGSATSTPILFQRCTATAGCYATLASGVTSLALVTPLNDTALVTLGGNQLPCSAGAGAVVNVAATGTGKALNMQLQHSGTAATTYRTLDARTKVAQAHTNYRCDVATGRYQGFSPGSTTFTRSTTDFSHYGTPLKMAAGSYKGLYAGLLPDCTYWFAHSATYPPVCNQVPANPSTTSDVVFLVINATSGVSHLAG